MVVIWLVWMEQLQHKQSKAKTAAVIHVVLGETSVHTYRESSCVHETPETEVSRQRCLQGTNIAVV